MAARDLEPGFRAVAMGSFTDRIDLYNGFGRPRESEDATTHLLRTFKLIASELDELDAFAGRLAMETGQFWQLAPTVNRKTSVDRQLLTDIADLERDLVASSLARPGRPGVNRPINIHTIFD